MLLFSLGLHERLARTVAEEAALPRGRAAVGRFLNGELHVTVETSPAGQACALLGAVAPPDEHLLATLLVAHTLRKEGALRLTAVLPYLGYARHDRVEPGKSLATAWLGALLAASGVDEVVTVDVHSPLVHEHFPVPVRSLSPAPLLAAELARLAPGDFTVVAPDEGARARAEDVRRAVGIAAPVAFFTKERTPSGVVHVALQGAVGRRAVVVDDILDTGGTLVSACQALRRAGTEDISVMVTHGLFTGIEWERLWALGVERIYCTDTTSLPDRLAAERIVVLPVGSLLAAHLHGVPAPLAA